MIKRKVKILIRIFRIVAAIILFLSLYISGYAIYGIGLLVIAAILGLFIGIFCKEKLSTIIGQAITVLLTSYILFAFISNDLYLQ
ncbi:MAG: hypothetical protein JEZ08_25220 [Clostridiales bacterium]|nr:hypothetical protein [Clostridiales bacterium]